MLIEILSENPHQSTINHLQFKTICLYERQSAKTLFLSFDAALYMHRNTKKCFHNTLKSTIIQIEEPFGCFRILPFLHRVGFTMVLLHNDSVFESFYFYSVGSGLWDPMENLFPTTFIVISRGFGLALVLC